MDYSDMRNGIIDSHISLVPLAKKHTKSVVIWRNTPEIKKWFIQQTDITAETHEQWLEKRLSSNYEFNWAIEARNGDFIGAVSLYNIDYNKKEAEFGRFYIGNTKYFGKGLGRISASLVIKLATRNGIQRIYLEVKADNTRAISVYKSVGFEPESCGDLIKMSLTTTP